MRKVMGVLILAAVATAISLATMAADTPAGVKVGQPVPAFTLDDQNGKPVNIADYKGKIVVLEWINRECPYVKRHLEAKTMVNLAEKYKDKGVVWLGVDSTNFHDHADNLKTIQDNKLPYSILGDSSGTVGHMFDAKTTPEIFIINEKGTLAYAGGIDNDKEGDNASRINYVDKALTELTSGKAVTITETASYGCSVKFK